MILLAFRSMYNKGSCRACGTYLTPTSACIICKEYISWNCDKCNSVEDVIPKIIVEYDLCRKCSERNQDQRNIKNLIFLF